MAAPLDLGPINVHCAQECFAKYRRASAWQWTDGDFDTLQQQDGEISGELNKCVVSLDACTRCLLRARATGLVTW